MNRFEENEVIVVGLSISSVRFHAPRQALALVATLYFRLLRGLKRRVACLTFGHDKWTVSCGDWVCMRCHRVRHVQIPPLPADPSGLKVALKSLERDRDELEMILKLPDY